MAKCCTGEPWDSFIDGVSDGTLTVHSEDEVTGDITGTHHGQIRKGKCQNKKVKYEVTKDGVDYEYRGDTNEECTRIDGNRFKLKTSDAKPHAEDDDDEVWVATKGGGGDFEPDKDPKDPKKDEKRDYGSRQG